MLNTHFLYLLGHLRLLEEQHSVTSLHRSGIGLIGTSIHNQPYIHAVKCSAHHSELVSVCDIAPPLPSMSYFMYQKQQIEALVNNDDVDCIIMTAVCSDELLKFTINAAIAAGKDILLNNIPSFNEKELEELFIKAIRNDVLIDYSQALTFEDSFNQIKHVLHTQNKLETGLLRLSAHRVIEPENRLPFNILRGTITQKIELLLTLLPDFSFSTASIQFSHPFAKMEDGDVLIINLRHKGGLLISFELFFNTGNISDKLSLKQCNQSYEVENKVLFNPPRQQLNEKNTIFKQIDQFILKLHGGTKLTQPAHWARTNELTNEILKQLYDEGFI
ncbi:MULTISPECIES: hypothetical protein [Providencia]|uniref:hypothetical protein n=1 Tax=Providencia TaxID=586 RepID=UPI001E3C2F0E|nr:MULTISPECIES: hypothetical protein [Providencia]WEB83236.1 hypothetical protein LVJ10_15195 [Providencia rettgeri]